MKLRTILEAIQKPSGEPTDNGEANPAKKSSSDAAEKAHGLNLVSKPYGNWADPSSGQVVAKTVQGNLVKTDKDRGYDDGQGDHPDDVTSDQRDYMQKNADRVSGRSEEKPDANPGVPKLGNLKPQATPTNPSPEWMANDQFKTYLEFSFSDAGLDVHEASPEDIKLMAQILQKQPAELDGQMKSKSAAQEFEKLKQTQGPENPTEDDYKHYGPDESVNLRPMMVRLRIR